jgi:transposase
MIPADSFYARLAKWRDLLVDDEDYASLYKDSPRGRPSIPPSMVVLAMLLEYHDDCSDFEAEQRMRFDLRWKHALGLGLQDEGFDATVLCRFRRKLLERGLERNLFERLVRAARGAGLIAEDAAQLLDSSHILGAAGARDTYTLIRGAIRKLLRSLGYTPASRAELSERLWWYVDPAAPEKPDIDWSDPKARSAHLGEVVSDAREALSVASETLTRDLRPTRPPRCFRRSSQTMSRKVRLPRRVPNARAAHPSQKTKKASTHRLGQRTLPPETTTRGCARGWPRIASLAWSIPRCAAATSPSARRGPGTRST